MTSFRYRLVIIVVAFFTHWVLAGESNGASLVSPKISAELLELLNSSTQTHFNIVVTPKQQPTLLTKGRQEQRWTLAKHNSLVKSQNKSLVRLLNAHNAVLKRDFKSLSTLFVEVDRETLLALINSRDVAHIGLDMAGSGQMGEVHKQTKVDQVRQRYQLAGNDIEIAVLDSGVDTEHPDLEGKILSQICLADICANGVNDATDDHGHGTHVAGILASNGTIAQEGIAPAAKLHIVKVLDRNNNFSSMATIAAGLDHVINNLPNVDIVNMSLGSNVRFSGHCDNRESWISPLVQAIGILRARGVMVFVSSGNDGDTSGMQAPACISSVISVSAVYDLNPSTHTYYCSDQNASANKRACFANYSVTTDIFAPGTPVRSSWPHRQSLQLDGTSMAAPAVAGCGALLRSIYPDADVRLLEGLMTGSRTNMVEVQGGSSFPILDCLDVIERSVEELQPSPILELVAATDRVINGQNVHAEVRAFDAIDGVMDSAVIWRDQDGEIHRGRTLRLVLPEGRHSILAVVSNNNGKTNSLELMFDVLADDPPDVSILSPNNSQTYIAQAAVTLEANANDEFDGELSEGVEWYLDDQLLGTGGKMRQTFAQGTYNIVAKVTDSHDNSTSVDVTIKVAEKAESSSMGTSGGADWIIYILLFFAIFRRRFTLSE